jgi:hypothetical protein
VRLELSENNISGPFPNSVFNATSLAVLNLAVNDLTGSLREDFGERLEQLVLSNNNISGSIPTTIGLLERLNYLALEHNSLQGPIPSELGRCSKLGKYNRFALKPEKSSCQIYPLKQWSRTVGKFEESIGFASNSLTGSIPTEVGNLPKLGMSIIAFDDV